MKICDYIDEKLIFFLEETTKEEVLRTLVNATIQEKKLPDGEKFFRAISEREKIVSTGIGMGVAIPHAKLSTYDNFFVTVGILSKGVDWQALDRAPVRLIFLIGGPDDKQTEYLQILSSLTMVLRDEGLRKNLMQASNKEEVFDLFQAL